MNPLPNRHARRKALKTMTRMKAEAAASPRQPVTDVEPTGPSATTEGAIPAEAVQTAPPLSMSDLEEEAALDNATNNPEINYVFIPGKNHTATHVIEFMAMCVFRMLGVAPPAKGSLRYLQLSEAYAQALSPEASQWLRALDPEMTDDEAAKIGKPLPALIGSPVPPTPAT